jgi:hypothetical protein
LLSLIHSAAVNLNGNDIAALEGEQAGVIIPGATGSVFPCCTFWITLTMFANVGLLGQAATALAAQAQFAGSDTQEGDLLGAEAQLSGEETQQGLQEEQQDGALFAGLNGK